MTKKVHYLDYDGMGFPPDYVLCGAWWNDDIIHTDNSKEVTCKTCKKILKGRRK
jgi:hypothetical protein